MSHQSLFSALSKNYKGFKQINKKWIAQRIYLNTKDKPRGQNADWEKAQNIFSNPLRLILFYVNTPCILLERRLIEPTDRWLNRLEIFKIFEKISPVLEAIGVLLIPVVLAIAAQQYQDNLEKREEERLQDAKIFQYLNQLSTILLELDSTQLENDENEQIRALARVTTLTLLRDENFGGNRKGQVIEFLAEMQLIQRTPDNPDTEDINESLLPIISLQSADLSKANLSFANLSFANLSSANLSSANLSNANLSSANLSSANLSDVNFSSANLSNASLSKAVLISTAPSNADLNNADPNNAVVLILSSNIGLNNANLRNANLSNASLLAVDLRNSKNLKTNQLSGENQPYLCNVALPDTVTGIDPNRDCDQISQLLSDRYGYSPDNVKQIVERAKNRVWD